MSCERWRRSIAVGAVVFASAAPAGAQCIGFDRFPDDNPRSVVASGFQKAFIYHANGVEQIVLQPAYTGVARDFGVFLALPEIPRIDKVDDELFAELDRLTTPRVAPATEDKAMRATQAEESSWRGVSVISRELVGIYEATVLQASDRSSFVDWLEGNGYVWPAELEPVFAHYVEAGWFFVAMRIDRDVAEEARFDGPIQPVGVTFTQDEILMPMKLTSLTPGGVDFTYYLVTDTKVTARNIPDDYLMFSQSLEPTGYAGSAPQLAARLSDLALRTRQEDLAEVLDETVVAAARQAMLGRLWLTRYQGHFDREDLGEDFIWDPAPPGRTPVARALDEVLSPDQREQVADALRRGMRRIERVRLVAEVFDTNEGYGKPTFVNGIHVGDLAAIGGEGSDRWQTIEMELPGSVVHWLGDEVVVKIENYGREIPGKGRFADAYNIRNVRIRVDYDDETSWQSKRFSSTVCSVPRWKNCEGEAVKRWGDPVIIRF